MGNQPEELVSAQEHFPNLQAYKTMQFTPGSLFNLLIEYEGQRITPQVAGELAMRLSTLLDKKALDLSQAVIGESLDLMGISEAAEALGVSRQRTHQLREIGKMPQPVADLKATPVWLGGAVRIYASLRNTRTGRPPRTSSPS